MTCLIRKELSPQQVVAYLGRHQQVQLHHETVYQWLYADKAAGGELYKHLRIVSKPYRKRYGKYDRRGKIRNRVAIDACPKVVETRSRIGDWEGGTVIVGKGRKGALLTLVERKTLYTVIVRLEGKQAGLLAQAEENTCTSAPLFFSKAEIGSNPISAAKNDVAVNAFGRPRPPCYARAAQLPSVTLRRHWPAQMT